MQMDKQNEFSDSQAITATAISTNVIDTGGASTTSKNLGGDGGLFWVFQVDVAPSGGTGTGITATLESSSTANLATSPVVHATIGPVLTAALNPGTIGVVPMPFGNFAKFLGVRYTMATGSYAAGAVSSFLTRQPARWVPYANAI